jgi:FlaG/FlaF family flagellin (archaellin)
MTLRIRSLLAVAATVVLLPALAAVTPASAETSAFAPPAPTGLRATGTTGTSVALVWNAVSGADLYEIKRDGVVTGTAEIPSTMQVGLTPSTTYKFRVRAKDGGSTSPDSAEITVTTSSDPGGGGGKVVWAGARSSSYGISPFPNPCGWTKAMTTHAGYFPGSTGAGVWIVGNLSGNGVGLQFPHPGDGRNYGSRIKFAGSDKHERFLDYFDEHGIKVWLQVESGFTDMPTLIDLVLKRYKHHPSVLGFGVDVEWFNPRGPDLNDPVTDSLAQAWENRVKSHGANYTLFLKHFDQSSMPPNYRGQIVFVDDSQYFDSTTGFITEMKAWADRYYPNPVLYQIGYASDKKWWSKEAKPIPQTMGTKLASVTRQNFGVAWVDFTLKDVLPTTC